MPTITSASVIKVDCSADEARSLEVRYTRLAVLNQKCDGEGKEC